MSNPKVSVCIGVYNREKYLVESLESIFNQNYSNMEVLISDNSSTDSSVKIIKGVIANKTINNELYVQSENIGPDENYKFLVSKAKNSDYIALFHSDDVYDQKIIAKSVEVFNENKTKDVAIVLSLSNKSEAKDDKFSIFTYKQTLKHLLLKRDNPFNCPTAVWKKDVVLAHDFENRYPEANDLLGYIKVLRQNKTIIVINEVLHFYRIHEGQDSAIQNKKFRYSESGVYKVARDFIKQDRIISLYPLLFLSFLYEKLRYLKRFIRR